MKEIADAIDISEASVSRLESGKLKPSLDTIIALADALNVSLDYLTGRSDDPRRL